MEPAGSSGHCDDVCEVSEPRTKGLSSHERRKLKLNGVGVPKKPRKKPKRHNARRATGDPYAEGYEAAADGVSGDKNPYKAGSLEALQWDIGWHDTANDETVEDEL